MQKQNNLAGKSCRRTGQWQYCRLTTSLVDDNAIERGIVATRSVTPILHFFITAGNNELLSSWLMPEDRPLKEGRWLQMVAWLMDQDIFIAAKKSTMADYLLEKGEMSNATTSRSLQTMMTRSLPVDIEKVLACVYEETFKKVSTVLN